MIAAPRSFIGRLVKYFDLQSYIEPYTPKKYGDNEYAIHCPMCDKDEKLWVSLSKRVAICYFCDKGYDVPGLIRLLEDTTNTLKVIEVLRTYNNTSSLHLRHEVESVFRSLQEAGGEWVNEELPEIALPEGFKPAFKHQKLPPYFTERGISLKRAIAYDLGWTRTGFYENRLIVPVTQDERLVTFHARYMQKRPPKGVKKVRYPKRTKTSRMLFNIDRARNEDRIVLCEDVFSAMTVGRAGVGTFGTSISKYQLALLLGTSAREIVLMWDRDAVDKAYEQADRLADHWTVRVVELPDDRDPDEYARHEVRAMVDRAKATRGARLFGQRVRARLKSVS